MKKPPTTQGKYIGTLPRGDWKFCLVVIEGRPDVLVLVDKSGAEQPRMIVDGKLITLEP